MTLSPAAQRAWSDAQDACPYVSKDRAAAIAAAALRAAVEQCVYMDDYGADLINPDDLLAIATELESAS